MAVVEWGQGERQELQAAADLDALLDRVEAEARVARKPQAVQVTVEGAGTLGIVVGADRSFLHHVPADQQPPYMVSAGGEGAAVTFVFYVAGDHWTETLRRNTVEPTIARAAVRRFLAHGDLSPEVEWEEV